MKLSEMYTMAIEHKLIDLQALIMFLVFEKEVLTMDSDAKELDLYFLEKHQKRMNKELHAYKQKMNMKRPASTFKVFTHNQTFYVHALSKEQAMMFVRSLGHYPKTSKYVSGDVLTSKGVSIKELTKNTTTPSLIGVNQQENKYPSFQK